MRILGTTFKISSIWALLFLTIGAYHFFSTLLFLRVAIPTVGIVKGFRSQSVIANIESRYGSRRDTYMFRFPIIKFHTATGNEYELSKPTPTLFAVYEEDQAIDILYDPRNPGNSYQNSVGAIWGSFIFFSFLGSVIIFYRLTIVIKKHRLQDRHREGR